MSIEQLNQKQLENLIREILIEKMQGALGQDFISHKDPSGVISIKLPTVITDESNRLDTGHPKDQVYTKDLFSLAESPRLGCGMMEMRDTTFDWLLDYDEIDYIIEGKLTIIVDGRKTSAEKGELILIPKGSKIQFSVTGFARFLYVTYPADWANQ